MVQSMDSGESDPIQVDYSCQGMETSLMECSQRAPAHMRSRCWAYISVVLKCRVLNIPGIIIIIMINLLVYTADMHCVYTCLRHHFQFSTSKKIWNPNALSSSIQIEYHRTHAYLVHVRLSIVNYIINSDFF